MLAGRDVDLLRGVAVGGLAGCLSPGRPASGTDDCSGGERWTVAFARAGHGTFEGFRLVVDPGTVAFGDELTARLRNVTDEPLTVGTEGNYTVQERHDGGWRGVFSTETGMGWDGSDQEVTPGEEAFAWTFTVTETGFTGARYDLCGRLTPGEYRLAYWGLFDRPPTDARDDSRSGNLAVTHRFSIEE